jgi:hypothetical protein
MLVGVTGILLGVSMVVWMVAWKVMLWDKTLAGKTVVLSVAMMVAY